MLKKTSVNLRALILLRITKKLIGNTNTANLCKLEKLIETGGVEKIKVVKTEVVKPKTREEIKREIKKEVKEKLGYAASPKIKEELTFIVPERKKPVQKKPEKQQVQGQQRRTPPMPHPVKSFMSSPDDLPDYLKYLRPTKTESPKEIDLGKLNPFLQDMNVRTIEIDGENEKVNVTGNMGKKPTGVTLTKEEIEEIIDKFSREAKIPKTEGFFKVVYGNLILNAMVSKAISSRFIIKKM